MPQVGPVLAGWRNTSSPTRFGSGCLRFSPTSAGASVWFESLPITYNFANIAFDPVLTYEYDRNSCDDPRPNHDHAPADLHARTHHANTETNRDHAQADYNKPRTYDTLCHRHLDQRSSIQ